MPSVPVPNTSKPEPKPEPKSEPAPSAAAPAASPPPVSTTPGELPYGRRVPGRPGFVYSPYASQYQLVDVAGIAPGVEVRCPYTNKLFRVPELPAGETWGKSAEPKPVEQPKAEEKRQEPPKEMPKEQPKPTPAAQTENLPTASWAQKEKSLVQSPFGQPGQLVDVTDKAPGSKVVCPFTGKLFLVPAQ